MKESRRIRIAVVGCGFYAQNHLNAWSDLARDGADLVAVCDLEPAKASAAGERFSAASYTCVDQMFEREQIDLLDVTTQMGSHKELATKAAERKIAAIVQKPFAPDIDACREIVETATRNGAWLAVHENFRFSRVMRTIRETIDSGAIGTPNWGRLSFRTGFDVYDTQPYLLAEERFAILDCGTHLLDLARFFFGEVERLHAETQSRNPRVHGEDTATILLRHDSGAVSVVETTYEAHRIPDSFPETLVEIEGSSGSVVVSPGERLTVTTDNSSKTVDASSPPLPWTTPPWHASQAAVLSANAHFLATFRRGIAAETSGNDNLKTFALVESAYRSASTGSVVRPDEILYPNS